MKFQVHTFENGESSVAWISDQSEPLESMHSSIGPWLEAHLIHLDQASFRERLNREDTSPLVLFDIGFGIGTNSIAAFEAFLRGTARDLHITKPQPVGLFSGLC
ncbi:MAG: hypothetical protein HYX41_01220 [Bdellovibrio sp.]|nr:hypothetical protein [Bdellovibrio sp.]